MKLLLLLLALLLRQAVGEPGSWSWTRARTWARAPPGGPGRDPGSDLFLELDLSVVRHRVDPRFLSVTIGVNLAEKERFMALLSSVRLQTLTKALSPAFARFGGTKQDFMEFQPGTGTQQLNRSTVLSPETCGQKLLPWRLEEKLKEDWAQYQEVLIQEELEGNYSNFQYSELTVDQLNGFARCCDLDLVFGLNALLRTPDNVWDGTNADLLLRYCNSKGYKMSWELGNEPNSYRKKAGIRVEGQQLGLDFGQLRKIMGRYELYQQASLFGPDVGQPKNRRFDLLGGFLQTGAEFVDAITWHQYYVNGRETSLKDFLDPDILDHLIEKIKIINQKVSQASPPRPVYLGETSSAYGGGALGLSDVFVSGFMWLDKLGLAASMGLDVVMRQTLFGAGRYTLVDPNLDPNPDYWLSLLHKRLVGLEVLKVKMFSELGQNKQVRVYLHCANRKSYPSGAVVLLSMNMGETPVAMLLPPSVSGGSVEAFVLQSDQPGLQGVCSRSVMLNGVVLKMVDDQTFPDLSGARLPPAAGLQLPPLSLAFFLFPEAGAAVCS